MHERELPDVKPHQSRNVCPSTSPPRCCNVKPVGSWIDTQLKIGTWGVQPCDTHIEDVLRARIDLPTVTLLNTLSIHVICGIRAPAWGRMLWSLLLIMVKSL